MDEANSLNGPLWKRFVVLVSAVVAGGIALWLASPPLRFASFWSFVLWVAIGFVVVRLGGRLLGLPNGWRWWGGSKKRLGPTHFDGEARGPHTGSTSTRRPSISM